MAFSSRCSSNGSGRFGARPAQGREQLVGGARLVPVVGQDLHDLTYRRDVPELGVDARRGGRLGEDGLSSSFWARAGFAAFWFPAWPVRTERILVARHSAGHSCTVLSARSNNFRDDAGADSFRGVQDRFCFHPRQRMIVGTLLPPDQDGGLLRGDPDPHAPIISETAQEIHEKHGFVSCQP